MEDDVTKRIDGLEAKIRLLEAQLSGMASEMRIYLKRYAVPCPGCKKEFDLLVNHYSIGLFDNLVYVKCPHCHKSMPVVDQEPGGIRVVSD